MVERDPLSSIEAAVVHGAHMSFSPADANVAAFEAVCLARVEAAAPHSLRNPVLLVGKTLVDVHGMTRSEGRRWRRCSLGESNG
jgi:hypothetical protein